MNKAQKIELLQQSKAHFAADMLLKGRYATEEAEQFKGCSVGCHLHHIKPKMHADEIGAIQNKHAIVAKHYGYPEWLAILQDTIFEGLPNDESAKWHVDLAKTLAKLPSRYNWHRALHRVHVAILRVSYRTAGSAQEAVKRVLDLHERAGKGERVSDDLWSAARSAARDSAWNAANTATRAAYAAARNAAHAARNAAKSAARDAAESAARNAAHAAWGAARDAAESAAYQEIRDGVLAALNQKE